jgi:hydroxypyruvate isomerase
VLRYSANLSLLFRELPLIERFEAARACGFDAVEIQFPYEYPAAALRAAAARAGLPIVLINAPIGPDPASAGIACRKECGPLYREALERACEYAGVLGVPCVNVLAGRCAESEREACLAVLTERLGLAAEVLASVGARALLEPINPLDVPGYCVADFDLARGVLARCGSHIGLQFDIYHAARLGLEPIGAFTAVGAHTAHVQFADCPGRHEPGTGRVPFAQVFAAIEASGYGGFVGAEYHPSGRTADSLAWLAGRGASRSGGAVVS